jgi:aminoglycoside N3'-acetyltransferase
VGLLTEFACNDDRFIKSRNLVFSHALYGADVEVLIDDLNPMSAFGHDTLFSKLFDYDFHIVFLGANWNAMTYIHHLEQRMCVNYGFLKDFDVFNEAKEKTSDVSYQMYVRNLPQNLVLDLNNLRKELATEGFIVEKFHGRGSYSSVSVRDLTRFVFEKVKEQPQYLVRKSK